MIFGVDLPFGSLVTIFLIGITTLFLTYWYSTLNHDYWKKKRIAFVKPLPFLGTIIDSFRMPFHDLEQKRYLQYGPIYGHFEASNPLLTIAEPALLRDILVKDFQYFTTRRHFSTGDKIFDNMMSLMTGEDWKRVRTIVSPTFSTGKIKRVMNIFRECSRTLVKNFKELMEDGKPINCKRLYGALAMDVIASSAFSTKIDSHNDPDNKFVQTARTIFERNSFNWRFILYLTMPSLMRLCKVSIFAPKGLQFFRDVTLQIIEERKKTGQVRNDFLQLLLDTAKEVEKEQKWDTEENEKGDITSNYGEGNGEHQIFKSVTSKNLSMDELVAQCVVFFIAGYDTTASTLSFATYLLALNQDIQNKLHAEIDGVLKETNGEVTYEAVQSMKYLDNVISETLRLFPPLSRLERTTEADYKFGDRELTVSKGTIITIPIHAMHRDPKYFPNPEKFDPDRFTAEERTKRDQYAYLPFGAGPRNCVGMRFALMEIKVCLANVISTFVIKKSPQTKVPLEFHLGQSLLQPKEILVELEMRKNCSLKN